MNSNIQDRPDTNLFQQLTGELLGSGKDFRFRAVGASMAPAISDGEMLRVEHADVSTLSRGDIILFKDESGFRAHRLVDVDLKNNLFTTRGDASLENDCSISTEQILGRVISQQANFHGRVREVSLCGMQARTKYRFTRVKNEIAGMLRRIVGQQNLQAVSRVFIFRYLPIILLALIALSATSFGQVAFDNSASNGTRLHTGVTSITVPLTVGAGSNRLLIVGVSINRQGHNTVVVNTVTDGASTLTSLGTETDTANRRRIEMFSLLNPPTGANSIVVTFSNVNGTNVGAVVGAASFTNVSQSTPTSNFTVARGTTGSPSVTVTSSTGAMVIDTSAITGDQTETAGAGQTARWGQNSGGAVQATDVYGFGSTEAGAASVTMSETATGGTTSWATGAVSINPVAVPITVPATVTGTNNVLIVGVSMNITGNTGATVSSVTYNGVALALAGAHNDSGNTRRVEIWYLVAPATGTNNVIVNLNLPGGTGVIGAVVGATNVSGADQTSPIRSFTSGDGAAAAIATLNVPSANGDNVVDTLAIAGTQTVTAYGPSQTQAWASASGAATTDVYGSGSTRSGAPSVPLSETFSGASNWSEGAVSVRPFQADLAVTISGNSVSFPGNVTYTAVVTNNGPTAATGVTLTDTLPAGLTLVTATPTQGTCGTPTITCNLGTLASGANATVTIVATPSAGGGYADTASVTGTVTDLNSANNSATGIAYSQLNVCTVPTTTAGGTLTGVINTYYPGTASVTAGSTSITLGSATGSTTPIASGDEVLIIQMQDAAINSSNNSAYGDGVNGTGSTNLNNSGIYEFATATSAVPLTGGTLSLSGAGPGGGLLFGYNSATATATQGQRTFQVVRVPHFATATLGTGLTAAAWNGSTGGIFVLDTSGALTLNGQTVSVDALGFRGGAGLQLNGGVTGSSTSDYRQASPTTYPTPPTTTNVPVNGIDGSKGEGIGGTPMWLEVANTPLSTGVDGYPNGSMGRGAPGNAGGGGTDANTANDQNSGGGGGANGGTGGFGGDAWNSNLSVGGLGGTAFPSSSGRIVMGGGGGAGTRNNSNNNASMVTQASSGAAGGGMIIIRAGSITGTGTMSANGADAYNLTSNDAGGGGGAGGTVVVLSSAGTVGTLTVNAHGGRGGDAWDDDANAGPPLADRHGPGGGGGGGVVLLSGAATINVALGAHGTTLPAPGQYQYGATDGTAGTSATNITYQSTPGPHFNATCTDVAVAKTAPATALINSGFSYSITVTNNGAVNATTVQLKDTLPAGVTFSSVTPAASCSQAAGTVTCNFATLNAGASTPVTINVTASAIGTVTNTATVSETQADYDLANNTASATTTILPSADVSIVKSASANPVVTGSTFSYILTVKNNGPSPATNVTVSDPIPSGVTYSSNTPSQGSCSFASGTVTCNLGTLANGATATVTINVVAGPPAKVSNTATVTATETDPVSSNNSSTFVSTITFTTEVKLETFTATSTTNGVLLSWKTGGEIRNLGFNVYREENGQRVRLNPSLIAGSSLMMRRADLQHSGKSYAWLDRSTAQGSFYWLEDVDLNGTRTLHGPVSVENSESGAQNPSASRMIASKPNTAVSSVLPQPSATIAEFNNTIPAADSSIRHQIRASTAQHNSAAQQLQFQIAAGRAIKIAIDHEGWYKITQPQLVAAGLNSFVNPASLQLFAEGVEQPILITGARTGFGGFGASAAIEFYGTGIDTPYSGQRIYWLVSGDQAGARIRYAVVSGSGPQPKSFPQTVELEQKTTFFAALSRGGPNLFFGALVSSTPVDQMLVATDLASVNDDGKLEVVLQGVTEQTAHDVSVSFNGTSLGDAQFSNQDEGTADFTVPRNLLQEGNNTVTLTSQNGEDDLSFVDHILLTYPRSYVAETDSLKFTAQGGDSITVQGFKQNPTQVLDITNPNAPLELPFRTRALQGTLALDVNVAGFQSVSHTILALADDQLQQPASISANQPSNWHSSQAGADVVMISAPDFLPQVMPLVQLRQSQGKSVALVNVQDIYDEFNFGEKDPATIRQFLQSTTKNWRHAPKYLLLVGDASIDPRNFFGLGSFDFVPTMLVPTAELNTASDDWFSDFTNTGFAQIETGRLPIRTAEEAQTVVGKILGYENGQTSGPWNSQVLMVADKDDGTVPFSQQAQAIQALLPPSLSVTDVFAGTMTPSAAQQAVLDAINSGKLLVNYDGHGSVEVWSDENLMTDDIASSLTNGPRLPVFVIMNCLNGYFQDVFTESMAEALLLSNNGGAIAVWASSGLTSPDPQFQMDEAFTSAVFAPGATLGDAIQTAKSGIADSDVRSTFILFGDPLLRLKVPTASSANGKGKSRH